MATLAAIARDRKNQLKALMLASRRLDARQETLEREVKRIVNRKQAVPELADAERMITMASAVEAELANMAAALQAVSQSWGMQY